MSVRATNQNETDKINMYTRNMQAAQNNMRKKQLEPPWQEKPLHGMYHHQNQDVEIKPANQPDKVDKAAGVIDGPVAKNSNIRKMEQEKLEIYQGLRKQLQGMRMDLYIQYIQKRKRAKKTEHHSIYSDHLVNNMQISGLLEPMSH